MLILIECKPVSVMIIKKVGITKTMNIGTKFLFLEIILITQQFSSATSECITFAYVVLETASVGVL